MKFIVFILIILSSMTVKCQNIGLCNQLTSCLNGGTCIQNTTNRFTCVCKPGFTGSICQNNITIDFCASQPCKNGAKCSNTPSGFNCKCYFSYTGFDCGVLLSCDLKPCQNGGTCQRGYPYYCLCGFDFSGPNCETNYKFCEDNPCQNGGTCQRNSNGTGIREVCNCPVGYTGIRCETLNNLNNSCSSNPCVDGECSIQGSSFICTCPSGITGNRCQNTIGNCQASPCKNNAQCSQIQTNIVNCTCPVGFTGSDCSKLIANDPCKSNPCLYGYCLNKTGGYSCLCENGFTGANCDNKINTCADSNPSLCAFYIEMIGYKGCDNIFMGIPLKQLCPQTCRTCPGSETCFDESMMCRFLTPLCGLIKTSDTNSCRKTCKLC